MLRQIATVTLAAVMVAVPLAAEQNNEVFLSLTRKAEPIADLPTNVSVVNEQRIAAEEAVTLGDALSQETSVNVSKTGTLGQNSTMMIRGSSSEQALLLVDGRRANSLSLGTADLSTITTNKIDRIEIIRGAASAIYGTSAFGGVVNVITKRATAATPVIDFGLSYGSFNTQVYSLNSGFVRNNVSVMLMINKTLSDGWRDNSDFDANDFTVNLGYDAARLGLFDLSASVYRSVLGVPGMITGLTPDRFNGSIEKTASTPDARQTNDNQYLQLTYTKPWNGSTLKARVYMSDDRLNYAIPSWFSYNDYESPVYGTELQYATTNGLTAGGEWWEEKHVQDDLLAKKSVIDRSRVNSAGYIQQEWKFFDRLSLIPSFRFDDNSAFGSVMTPRLTVAYKAGETLKLSANSGTTWRAPTFNELYYPLDPWGYAGNPDLKPEEGISSDVGVEYLFASYRSALTVFLTDTDNLIVWGTQPVNIGKSRQSGVELEVSGTINGGLSHRIGYTYLWAEDLDNGAWLNYRPQNTVDYTLACLLPWNSRIDLSVKYVGTQKTETPGVSLPEYTMVGLRLARKLADADIWIKADNLTGSKYETRLGFPLPGVTVTGGVNIRFWE